MAMSVQQGDLPQKENTMKRLFAGTLALVMTCGLLFSGCGKQMTPEEEAASQEAAISQQLQDEENKTGLKRLISNNLTEYEQPVHDFIEGLDDLSVDIQDTQSAQPAKQGRGQVVNSDDDVSLDDVDLFDDSTVSRTEERPQNVKTSGKTMGSQKQPQTTQNNSDIDYMSLNDISIFDSEE